MRRATAAAFFLTACAYDGPLHGDVTFTAEERVLVEDAQTYMTERMGVPPRAIVWDAEHVGGDAAPPWEIQRRDGCWGLSGRGMALGAGCLVTSARHEWGHWHGLHHHSGEGVMAVRGGEAWTGDDAASCVADGYCRAEVLE